MSSLLKITGDHANLSFMIQSLCKLQAIRGQNAELTVTISGDTGADYGRVIGLMALLKEAGFDKVGLKTEPQPYRGKKKK